MQLFFDFEWLDVYQVGRELNREVASIVAGLPPGSGESRDTPAGVRDREPCSRRA